MKIDLKQEIKNHRGKSMPNEDGPITTLELIAYSALSNLAASEANLGRDERLKRGRLAQRIVAAEDGKIDLKAEEIALLKQCIGQFYGPWVVATTEDMLEAQEPPKLSVA